MSSFKSRISQIQLYSSFPKVFELKVINKLQFKINYFNHLFSEVEGFLPSYGLLFPYSEGTNKKTSENVRQNRKLAQSKTRDAMTNSCSRMLSTKCI